MTPDTDASARSDHDTPQGGASSTPPDGGGSSKDAFWFVAVLLVLSLLSVAAWWWLRSEEEPESASDPFERSALQALDWSAPAPVLEASPAPAPAAPLSSALADRSTGLLLVAEESGEPLAAARCDWIALARPSDEGSALEPGSELASADGRGPPQAWSQRGAAVPLEQPGEHFVLARAPGRCSFAGVVKAPAGEPFTIRLPRLASLEVVVEGLPKAAADELSFRLLWPAALEASALGALRSDIERVLRTGQLPEHLRKPSPLSAALDVDLQPPSGRSWAGLPPWPGFSLHLEGQAPPMLQGFERLAAERREDPTAVLDRDRAKRYSPAFDLQPGANVERLRLSETAVITGRLFAPGRLLLSEWIDGRQGPAVRPLASEEQAESFRFVLPEGRYTLEGLVRRGEDQVELVRRGFAVDAELLFASDPSLDLGLLELESGPPTVVRVAHIPDEPWVAELLTEQEAWPLTIGFAWRDAHGVAMHAFKTPTDRVVVRGLREATVQIDAWYERLPDGLRSERRMARKTVATGQSHALEVSLRRYGKLTCTVPKSDEAYVWQAFHLLALDPLREGERARHSPQPRKAHDPEDRVAAVHTFVFEVPYGAYRIEVSGKRGQAPIAVEEKLLIEAPEVRRELAFEGTPRQVELVWRPGSGPMDQAVVMLGLAVEEEPAETTFRTGSGYVAHARDGRSIWIAPPLGGPYMATWRDFSADGLFVSSEPFHIAADTKRVLLRRAAQGSARNR